MTDLTFRCSSRTSWLTAAKLRGIVDFTGTAGSVTKYRDADCYQVAIGKAGEYIQLLPQDRAAEFVKTVWL